MNIEEVFKVYGKKYPGLAPDNYKKMMIQVVPHMSGTLPWEFIIPSDFLTQAKTEQQNAIDVVLEEIGQDIDYYTDIYQETNSVFKYLQPAKINAVKHKIYSMDEDAKDHLANWTPDKYGYIQVPEYTLAESLTGRMKIKSGPNILLLQKKYRGMLTSRFGDNGSIWYLDFTSLEPRVALSLKSYLSNLSLIGYVPLKSRLEFSLYEPMPKDVYSLALKTLKLTTEVSRDMIKQIVLSQLYGQSKSITIDTLEKLKVRDPEEVVEMVNDFFGIDNLRKFVSTEYAKTDNRFLKNFYGRHLTPEDGKPHALLNYYIQSTAVDVALLGFKKILSRLESTPNALSLIVPIFFLHDAMFLDVHKDVEHLIPKLCSLGSKDIPGFRNQSFWMSGNKL